MPGFTSGGGKPANANGKSDGLLPTKKAASVKKVTGSQGFPIADDGGVAPRASRKTDGVPFKSESHDESMSGKSGPNHGKSFHRKFNTSAMSQAIRGRKSSGY